MHVNNTSYSNASYSLRILGRLFADAVIFCAVVNGWWFLVLPVGLVAAWYFSLYFELLVAGVVYDALFGVVPEMGWWGYIGSIGAACGMVVVSLAKKMVRRR